MTANLAAASRRNVGGLLRNRGQNKMNTVFDFEKCASNACLMDAPLDHHDRPMGQIV